MAAIRIVVQFLKINDNACPKGVQMNVANQLFKIYIFLADNGFVTVLK